MARCTYVVVCMCVCMYVCMYVCVCAQERPPILQHQLTTMQRLFPTKDRRVVILKSVLVPNGLPVPRALLFKECCFQLVIGTSLLGQRQQNEHNLFIQAEREEVCLFRQHNCKMYS